MTLALSDSQVCYRNQGSTAISRPYAIKGEEFGLCMPKYLHFISGWSWKFKTLPDIYRRNSPIWSSTSIRNYRTQNMQSISPKLTVHRSLSVIGVMVASTLAGSEHWPRLLSPVRSLLGVWSWASHNPLGLLTNLVASEGWIGRIMSVPGHVPGTPYMFIKNKQKVYAQITLVLFLGKG